MRPLKYQISYIYLKPPACHRGEVTGFSSQGAPGFTGYPGSLVSLRSAFYPENGNHVVQSSRLVLVL